MKKAIYIILLAFIAVFTFASCEREYAMSEVGTESIAPVLQGVSDQSIDANNAKVESVIFNWSPASFGAPVQIQYTLYLTRPDQADYLIGQTFSTSVAVEKASINSGAVALGIPKNGTGTVGAKVVAEVYTGPTPSSSFAMKNTSNSISFDVTTFEAAKDWIFLPGVYNGWGDSNEKEEWKVWETDGGNKKYRTLVQLKEADWDAVLSTNLKSVFNCTRAAVKYMMKARSGRIVSIQMADRFVCQQEIKGLAEGADERHALLLSEAHLRQLHLAFVRDAECFEPRTDVGVALVVGESVLDLHIFPSRQFREKAQFLEHRA